MSDLPPPTVPPTASDLLVRNKAWAAEMTRQDPAFFERLVAQQTPKFFWIGCSDSRVPANEIVGLAPGELFVHRNVSNLVIHTDLNCLTALQFAVDVLKVDHVIVSGHYGCGGIRAALENTRLGLSDNWLRHVQDVIVANKATLDAIDDSRAKWDRLCELNVEAQVDALLRTTVIRDAHERGQKVSVHGWIYGIQDGILRQLTTSDG